MQNKGVKRILGNKETVDFLESVVSSGKTPAAILLVGPKMVGKTTIFEHLAQIIICEQGELCGSCAGCKIGLQNHPDVLRQVPGEEENLRKGINAIIKRIHERPVMARKIIVFLENIDRFSWAATPILLKALEDAPNFVVFFLTASNIESVLPTVRSRCLIRTVNPVSEMEMRAFFEEERGSDQEGLSNEARTTEKTFLAENIRRETAFSANDDVQSYVKKEGFQGAGDGVNLVKEIVVLSGGRPGLFKRIVGDVLLKKKYQKWFLFIKNRSSLSIGQRSLFADEIEKNGDGEEFMDFYQSILRNSIRDGVEYGDDLKKLIGQLRKSREAVAMLKANIPQRIIMEYVLFN